MAIEYHLNINDTHTMYSKPSGKKVSLLAINHSAFSMCVNRKELNKKYMIKRNQAICHNLHELVPLVSNRVSRNFCRVCRLWHIAHKL